MKTTLRKKRKRKGQTEERKQGRDGRKKKQSAQKIPRVYNRSPPLNFAADASPPLSPPLAIPNQPTAVRPTSSSCFQSIHSSADFSSSLA